jgi:hypothetical protein
MVNILGQMEGTGKGEETMALVDICDGCFADTRLCPCSNEQNTTISKCPCAKCIVKMMCIVVCEQWQTYFLKWTNEQIERNRCG